MDNPKRCTKIKRNGQRCGNSPIRGATVCRSHGGTAPQVKKRALVRAELMDWKLGDTTEDPGEVLLRLVTQSAARVRRYSHELDTLVREAEADGKPARDALVREAWGEFGPTGEYIRGLVQLENEERDRCAGFATKAIAAGLAERQVRIAERQAQVIVTAIDRIIGELGISDDQRAQVPAVAERVLSTLATSEGAA